MDNQYSCFNSVFLCRKTCSSGGVHCARLFVSFSFSLPFSPDLLSPPQPLCPSPFHLLRIRSSYVFFISGHFFWLWLLVLRRSVENGCVCAIPVVCFIGGVLYPPLRLAASVYVRETAPRWCSLREVLKNWSAALVTSTVVFECAYTYAVIRLKKLSPKIRSARSVHSRSVCGGCSRRECQSFHVSSGCFSVLWSVLGVRIVRVGAQGFGSFTPDDGRSVLAGWRNCGGTCDLEDVSIATWGQMTGLGENFGGLWRGSTRLDADIRQGCTFCEVIEWFQFRRLMTPS